MYVRIHTNAYIFTCTYMYVSTHTQPTKGTWLGKVPAFLYIYIHTYKHT